MNNNHILPKYSYGTNKNDKNYVKNKEKILNSSKTPPHYNISYADMYLKQYDEFNAPSTISDKYNNNCSSGTNESNDRSNNNSNNDSYDPYADFLYKNGISNRYNLTKYNTYYINIDSKFRQKTPSLTSENPIQLTNNPLQFYESTEDHLIVDTYLNIYCKDHTFQKDDILTLSGIKQHKIILRTTTDSNTPFILTTGGQYLRIRYTNITMIDQLIYNGTFNGFPWKVGTDDINLYVNISGFTGQSATQPFIGNIPINSLNGKHRVYISIPSQSFDPDNIYIKLPKIFQTGTTETQHIFQSSYNVTLSYEYTCGVANNLINANYPVTYEQLQGYHIVSYTTTNNIYIKINQRMGQSIQFGGKNILISKVIEVHDGYTEPNTYQITLNNTYENVVHASIVSAIFPNTGYVITDAPNRKNNAFYWENLDDGNHIYKVELTPGNFQPSEIATNLQNAVFTVPRVNYSSNNNFYTQNNFIKISMDTSTNIVRFQSFKQAILQQPFDDYYPGIPATPSANDPTTIKIRIKHINHGLSIGDTITISGSIDDSGISQSLLNADFAIQEVNDANSYSITIKNFNLLSVRNVTHGGNAVTIYVPSHFRIRNDFPDSVTKLLGFRDIGVPTSITNFDTIIRNSDEYFNEISVNNSGRTKTIKQNSLELSGDNYIIMTCTQLGTIQIHGTNIDNAFGMIMLTGIPGKMLFNTIANIPHNYSVPIPMLYRLDFQFLDPYGNLFDFNNVDHSYVIKIVTLSEQPIDTSIMTNIGKMT